MKLNIEMNLTGLDRHSIAANVLHIKHLQSYNRTGAAIWLSRADFVERVAKEKGCTLINSGLAKIGLLNHGS